MRKFPCKVGGLKDRQPMLSSGEDVTSMSCVGGEANVRCLRHHFIPNCLLSHRAPHTGLPLCSRITKWDLSSIQKGNNKLAGGSTSTAGPRRSTKWNARNHVVQIALAPESWSWLSPPLLPHRSWFDSVGWALGTCMLMSTSSDSGDQESQRTRTLV